MLMNFRDQFTTNNFIYFSENVYDHEYSMILTSTRVTNDSTNKVI